MNKVLDITPLRTLIAVAETGGFHRAADSLRMSQSTVSQHVRRLEKVIGAPVVEPSGRGVRFTSAGSALLTEARAIVTVHDLALLRLTSAVGTMTVGVTDHASDHLLPPIVEALAATVPGVQVTFRFGRTARLVEAVDRGDIDIALYVAEATSASGVPVGELPLRWSAAPTWAGPGPGESLALLAIEDPCIVRSRALDALRRAEVSCRVAGEASSLAGVVNAARAGLGVALLAAVGTPPDGLVAAEGLPAVPALPLAMRVRPGTPHDVVEAVRTAVLGMLASRVAA